MSFIKLTVKSSNYNCDIEFDRRMIFIKGNSGVGKTTLVDMLLEENSSDVEIYCNLPYIVVNSRSWEVVLSSVSNTLIIIDDYSFVASSKFASVVSSTSDRCNYFLIIAREKSDSIKSTGRLSYSSNDIYEFVADGKNHYIRPFYSADSSTSCSSFDCVITEDTTTGYDFFKRLVGVPCYPSSSGKSSLVNDIIEKSKIHKNILVILDTSAYGCHMEDFYTTCTYTLTDNTIGFIDDYECFEELLIRTNLINKLGIIQAELSNLPKYANQHLSWERYFEDLIKRATYSKPYKHTHDIKSLRYCYYEDCIKCNEHIREKCDDILKGDKFESLLRGTKYEFLLNLR